MTFEELIAAAKAAVAAGDLDKARDLTEQAQALKAIGELEPVENPELDKVTKERDELAEKMAKIEQEPPTKSAGYDAVVIEDEEDKRPSSYDAFGDFLMDVKRAGEGNYIQGLRPFRSDDANDEGGFSLAKALGTTFVGSLAGAAKAAKAAPTGLGESIPESGGFLVGTDTTSGILSRTYNIGQILQRVAMDTVGPNSNGMTYYAEAETSRATGSRRGGVRFYWSAEASTMTASSPKFRRMVLSLKKAHTLLYATEEQLSDSSALESYVNRVLPEELRFGIEDSIFNGTGSGMPEGILNSDALVSVAKESGQSAATVVAENISKMWARRWIGGTQNYIWVYNQDVEPQLDALSYSIGTGGALVYMPPGGLSGAPYGTIKGRPAFPVEYCETLGTVGDIALLDLSQYQMIDKGGIQAASSIHVRFLQDEQVFKFTYRIDGQPTWQAALTPYKGSSTVSPFIVLATRA